MNHAEMQRANRCQVLELLLEHDGLTRAEIARTMGLQKATITNIINEFEELGILRVADEDRASLRGQRLHVQIDTLFLIVLTIDRRDYRIRLYNLHGKVIHAVRKNISRDEALRPQVLQLIEDVRETAAQVEQGQVMGALLAMPGPYIRRERDVAYVSGFEALSQMDLRQELADALPFPVISEHDAKLSAYGEWCHARELHDNPNASLIYLGSVGSGIGSGFVMGGKILLGQLGTASEIGHMGINFNGPENEFDHSGTFEYYASADSALRYLRELYSEYPYTCLKPDSSYSCLVAEFERGDPLAVAVMERLANMLAYGIANLVFIINPDCVVLGADYPNHPAFLNNIRTAVRRMVPKEITDSLVIRYSQIEADTVLRGGFEYALHKMTVDQTLYDRICQAVSKNA